MKINNKLRTTFVNYITLILSIFLILIIIFKETINQSFNLNPDFLIIISLLIIGGYNLKIILEHY